QAMDKALEQAHARGDQAEVSWLEQRRDEAAYRAQVQEHLTDLHEKFDSGYENLLDEWLTEQGKEGAYSPEVLDQVRNDVEQVLVDAHRDWFGDLSDGPLNPELFEPRAEGWGDKLEEIFNTVPERLQQHSTWEQAGKEVTGQYEDFFAYEAFRGVERDQFAFNFDEAVQQWQSQAGTQPHSEIPHSETSHSETPQSETQSHSETPHPETQQHPEAQAEPESHSQSPESQSQPESHSHPEAQSETQGETQSGAPAEPDPQAGGNSLPEDVLLRVKDDLLTRLDEAFAETHGDLALGEEPSAEATAAFAAEAEKLLAKVPGRLATEEHLLKSMQDLRPVYDSVVEAWSTGGNSPRPHEPGMVRTEFERNIVDGHREGFRERAERGDTGGLDAAKQVWNERVEHELGLVPDQLEIGKHLQDARKDFRETFDSIEDAWSSGPDRAGKDGLSEDVRDTLRADVDEKL